MDSQPPKAPDLSRHGDVGKRSSRSVAAADESPPEPGRTWVAPVAAVGALAALVAAAVRLESPATGGGSPAAAGGVAPGTPGTAPVPVQLHRGGHPAPARTFSRQYTKALVLGGQRSPHAFHHSLTGVAVGSGDFIYALGDGEVRVFEPGGTRARGWKVVENAECLTVAPDGRVLVGAGDRVYVYDASGRPAGSFRVGPSDHPARVTAIKVHRDAVLVADAAGRVVRRLNADGGEVSVIGNQDKTNGFMLPNKWLDIDVDAGGVVYATDTGRHQVTSWTLDGAPVAKFGKFGMLNAEDFVGCCNPVNLALLPDGGLVTAEKVAARVKVFAADRQLLAVIGPEHFDPNCVHIHVAVDSRGRILAGDPLRREIMVFGATKRSGA